MSEKMNKSAPIGTPSESDLLAYVDGAMEPEPQSRLAAWLVSADENALRAQGRATADRNVNAWLRKQYASVLSEPVPQGILDAQKALADCLENLADESRALSSKETPENPAPLAASANTQTVFRRWNAATNWARFSGLAATLVLGVGIGAMGMAQWGPAEAPKASGVVALSNGHPSAGLSAVSYSGEDLARQSAVAHVMYAPDVTRPVEMGADQEPELVQWMSSRLKTDIRPPVLTAEGYELMGGRLLPGTNGPIAQFMYHDATGERITLCVSRRKDSGQTAFKLYQDGSVSVFYWIAGDFGYAVSGAINHSALLAVSRDAATQLDTENKK